MQLDPGSQTPWQKEWIPYMSLHITLHFHFRLKLGWCQRNFDNSPAYITTFKEREAVPTTTERSEICKYYFIELFYFDLDLEFRLFIKDDRGSKLPQFRFNFIQVHGYKG